MLKKLVDKTLEVIVIAFSCSDGSNLYPYPFGRSDQESISFYVHQFSSGFRTNRIQDPRRLSFTTETNNRGHELLHTMILAWKKKSCAHLCLGERFQIQKTLEVIVCAQPGHHGCEWAFRWQPSRHSSRRLRPKGCLELIMP